MIAIDVEFLTGRYVATSFNDRSRAEWPPHPARLFSALVATWAEQEEPDDGMAAALEWLATAGPPQVRADGARTAPRRTVMQVYVPDVGSSLIPGTHRALREADHALAELRAAEQVGDARSLRSARTHAKKMTDRATRTLARDIEHTGDAPQATIETAVALLPSSRGKQPRTFPSVVPEHRRVTFVWPDAGPSDAHRAALMDLLARVARLGHSSSLVSCRLSGEVPDAPDVRERWIPDENGDEVLRVASEGQFERLRVAYAAHLGVEPRVLPCRFQRYRAGGATRPTSTPRSVFGRDWLVFREVADPSGRRVSLRLTRATDVARALRGALMHYADDPPPAVITGHTDDRRPLDGPHAAFLSLADVASPWASGAVLGVALVLPRTCSPEDRMAAMRAVGRWEQAQGETPLPLHLGRAGLLRIERVTDDDPRQTLDPRTWCGTARHWASVTPVALDENPGNLAAADAVVAARAAAAARGIVARSCERIGLPAPVSVEVMRRSVLDGCPEARRFMPFPSRNGALRRVCVHVELIFEEPVEGPILLGAGRYQGLGLLRPVLARKPEASP